MDSQFATPTGKNPTRGSMRTPLLVAASIGAMIVLAHGSVAQAAEIRVIAPGLMTAMFKELQPQFERETGHKLVTWFAPTAGVKREIDAGGAFDLAISNASAIDNWVKEGKIVGTTRVAVAYVGLGVGVRRGAPRPDIASVEAFRLTLLNAKSVAHGAESASAAHFRGLLDRLGIAEEMKPRLKPMGGGTVVKSVASGDAEMGIATVPTILAASGVDLVGPLPAELQTYVNFTAGISSSAKEPEAAQALLKFLASQTAIAVIKTKGLEPGALQ